MGGSDADATSRGVCPSCLRSFSLTAAGLIRTHGPVDKRCPGSCNPPVARTDCSSDANHTRPRCTDDLVGLPLPSAARSDDESLQFPLTLVPPVRVLKWIPKASREQEGRMLTTILELARMMSLHGRGCCTSVYVA